jgi:hypothetical protein
VSEAHQKIWNSWANRLQQMGLQHIAAAVLESTGPLNLIGAQFVYLSQPLLNTLLSDEQLIALAHLLEEPSQTAAFISNLQEVEA